MSARFAILEDQEFWSSLEFTLTRWLAHHEQAALRRVWIDGFIPEELRNTPAGVEVLGRVWLGTSPREQSAYQFIASIPRKLLGTKNREFAFADIEIDEVRCVMQLALMAPQPTNTRPPR